MITGSIVALVTPMADDGSIHWDSLKSLIDWHIAEGTAAIVPVGTTGESATLNVDEHCQVVSAVVETVAGRVPVIAGTGANSTAEAIELTAAAADAGADACLLVTPYYNKPTQEGLSRHSCTIADAVPLPQLLYNVPSRTACDLLPDTIARLAQVSEIIGVKEATGILERGLQIRESCGADFAIYSGDDATACDLMLGGANGTISVTANVAPGKMAAMCNAAVAGDGGAAKALDEELAGLHRDLFLEANPIPAKWALREMGMIPGGIRLPLTEFSASYHDALRASMRQAGV
ncbi:MAG: 4-hydroxy-tetrahydrodipicolinate synthase [Pseudomonadales bacterium]